MYLLYVYMSYNLTASSPARTDLLLHLILSNREGHTDVHNKIIVFS